MLKFATCIAIAIAAAAPANAANEPAGDEAPPKVAVFYGDLDLASTDGEKTLTARIRSAAYDLCEPLLHQFSRRLLGFVENRRCNKTAIASTHQQVAFAVARARQGRVFAATDKTLVVVAAR